MLEQQLAVGGTYRFTFKPEFVRHGVCPSGTECLHKGGGVFKVQQICTYVEILQANINLYANFFAPLGYSTDEYQKYYNGKPEDQYTPEYTALDVPVEYYKDAIKVVNGETTTVQEKVTGTSHRLVETGKSTRTRKHLENLSFGFNPIYKLIDVVDPDDIVYAPEKTILGVPEIGIREYQNMTLAITVGYWDDASKLDGLILNVRERLAAYGIRPQNIEAFSSESAWMTPEEYDETVDKARQPGRLVELDEDNAAQYDNRSVVIDGEFVKLIDNLSDKHGAAQPEVHEEKVLPDGTVIKYVGAKSLSRQTTVLDNIPFLRPISTGDNSTDIFETNKHYLVRIAIEYLKENAESPVSGRVYYTKNGSVYNKVGTLNTFQSGVDYYFVHPHERNENVNYGDIFIDLTEGKDYAAGDPLVRYTPYAEYAGEDKEDLPTFKDSGPDYVPIFSPVAAQSALEEGIKLYTCKNADDGYEWANGVFRRSASYDPTKFEEFTGTSIAPDDMTLYFYKNRDHIWEEWTGDKNVGGVYVQITSGLEYFMVDYSRSEGLEHLGQRFSYATRFNTRVTLDLSADNLVSLCSDTEVARIFVEDRNLINKYRGRWYTYQEKIGVNSSGKPIYEDRVIILSDSGSVEVNRNDSTNNPGAILGVSGTSWSRCFITTDKMERSYLKKYHDELAENTRLQAKVAALESLILKYHGQSSGS